MSWEPEIVRTVDLGYDQMMVIESQRGALIRVVHGGVWLTEEGLSRDVFAQGGDDLPVEGDGRAVVQGLGYARIELVERRGTAALARAWFTHLLQGLRRALSMWSVRGQLGARAPY